MKKERFEELSEALRQAKAVRRGAAAPSRVWSVTRGKDGQLRRRQLDPKEYQRERGAEWEKSIPATRTRLRLSQIKFAELLGISVKTLHNWRNKELAAQSRRARREFYCAWHRGIRKWFWKRRWRDERVARRFSILDRPYILSSPTLSHSCVMGEGEELGR